MNNDGKAESNLDKNSQKDELIVVIGIQWNSRGC